MMRKARRSTYLRDSYVERAFLAYDLNDWDSVIKYSLQAKEIKTHPKIYINEVFSYNETLDDLLSIAYFHKENYSLAKFYAKQALKINSKCERLEKNLEIINNSLKNS